MIRLMCVCKWPCGASSRRLISWYQLVERERTGEFPDSLQPCDLLKPYLALIPGCSGHFRLTHGVVSKL